ncbi:MAG: DUF6671 family protein [Bacteroidota bacterium]
MSFFSGRKIIIATKHQKEKIIGPKVALKLRGLPLTTNLLDTDLLGTFTGEVERIHDPIKTARLKCEMAMDLTGADIAISSEGSFGAHPTFIFSPCNEELILLKDRKNDIEIIGKKLSTNTNLDGQLCSNMEELINIAKSTGFPSHGLILRNDKNGNEIVEKGITEWKDLESIFKKILSINQKVYVETDMRAMHNPKRQEVIAQATDAMIQRALRCCQKCNFPGYGVTSALKGLPCDTCGLPTKSIKALIYSCQKCGFSESRNTVGKKMESAQYCDFCNP